VLSLKISPSYKTDTVDVTGQNV